MRPSIHLLCLTSFAAVTLLAAPAVSAEARFSIGAGLQGYLWQEFRSSDDTKLLEEQGIRYTGHLGYDNYDRRDEGFVYGFELSGHIGSVDYEGQTLGGTPIGSTTEYLGGRADWRGGKRYMDFIAGLGVDLLFGLGIDYWEREIKDTTIPGSPPVPVQGYLERYKVIYLSAGIGFYRQRERWDQYLQMGVRHPLSVDEKVSTPFDVDLSPENNTSGFVYWHFYRHDHADRRDWAVTLYFDSLRFSDSPPRSSGLGLVYQPESDQNQFGVRVSRFF